MGSLVQNANRLIAKASSASAWRMTFLLSFMLMLVPVCLHSQCPDSGQTKVIKPNEGTGYYFKVFMGESSFAISWMARLFPSTTKTILARPSYS